MTINIFKATTDGNLRMKAIEITAPTSRDPRKASRRVLEQVSAHGYAWNVDLLSVLAKLGIEV